MKWHVEFVAFTFAYSMLLTYPQLAAAHLTSNLGRFMQRDPIGYVLEKQLYLYNHGSAPNNRDPSGLWPVCPPCASVPLPAADAGSKLGRIMSKFQNSNCGPLKVLECFCDRMGWRPNKGGDTTYTPAVGTTIRVCADRGFDKDAIKQHELVHAWDLCTVRNQGGNYTPDDLACSEIRAYSYDGSCDNEPNEQQRDECIMRGAINSMLGPDLGLTPEDVGRLVGNNLRRCKAPRGADLPPIEQRPRPL
jgi:Peptidase M76 family